MTSPDEPADPLPEPPAPKAGWLSDNKSIVIVVAIFVLLIGGAAIFAPGDNGITTSAPSATDPPDPLPEYSEPFEDPATAEPTESVPPTTITYRITGRGTALITYTADSSGAISQASGAQLPWAKTITLGEYDTGGFWSVSAQRNRGDSGSITCEILNTGRQVSTNSATGPYSIVECQVG